MRTPGLLHARALALPLALSWGSLGCGDGTKAPALSHTEEVVRSAPIPAENAPKLGVVSEQLDVREATDLRGPSLGQLHAGARVARSNEPVSRSGCAGGWFAI